MRITSDPTIPYSRRFPNLTRTRSAVMARVDGFRNTKKVPAVDSTDDTIRRFVVYVHAYDPKRHERRPIEVGSFDDEAEAMRCFGEAHLSVMSRREAEDADSRDHVTMVVKEPGVDERSRQRRIEERSRRRA